MYIVEFSFESIDIHPSRIFRTDDIVLIKKAATRDIEKVVLNYSKMYNIEPRTLRSEYDIKIFDTETEEVIAHKGVSTNNAWHTYRR